MIHPLRLLTAAAALVATLAFGAARARADLAPPDSCTSPGQPCTTAGPQFDAAGTCVAMTCTKQVPSPDGGTMSMTYDCHRCQVVDGGAGGNGAGGGGSGGSGAGGSGGGAGGSSQPTSKSSGCAVAPEAGESRSVAGPVVLIVGLAFGAARRRRRPIG